RPQGRSRTRAGGSSASARCRNSTSWAVSSEGTAARQKSSAREPKNDSYHGDDMGKLRRKGWSGQGGPGRGSAVTERTHAGPPRRAARRRSNEPAQATDAERGSDRDRQRQPVVWTGMAREPRRSYGRVRREEQGTVRGALTPLPASAFPGRSRRGARSSTDP